MINMNLKVYFMIAGLIARKVFYGHKHAKLSSRSDWQIDLPSNDFAIERLRFGKEETQSYPIRRAEIMAGKV